MTLPEKYSRLPEIKYVPFEVPESQENWFSHREPYVYSPRQNVIYYGPPGAFHMDLQDEARDRHGFDTTDPAKVYGSVYTHPETEAQAHTLHGYSDQGGKYNKLLEDAIGVPIQETEDLDPEEDRLDKIENWQPKLTHDSSYHSNKFFTSQEQHEESLKEFGPLVTHGNRAHKQ